MQSPSKLQPWGLTILRVVVGVVFLAHGAQKFQMGFANVAGFLGSIGVPLPSLAAIVLTLVEFLGGIALLTGLLTRWVALVLALDMLVAILRFHLKNGFFMPLGFEFALTLFAATIALVLAGGGAASLDNKLKAKSERP